MPSTYTHHCFGEAVLAQLPTKVQTLLNRYHDLFEIGLYGPDILFFYDPLKENSINQLGHLLHEESGREFLDSARCIAWNGPSRMASVAYAAGFLCHFVLDSTCHPYVNSMAEYGISHSRMEAELDALLMTERDLDPRHTSPAMHIEASEKSAGIISRFYEPVTPQQILTSLESMKTIYQLLMASSKPKTMVLKHVFKSLDKPELFDLVTPAVPGDDCQAPCIALKELFDEAVKKTVELLPEYLFGFPTCPPLTDPVFDKTFNG